MARVIDTPSGGGFVGPFEPQVFELLKKELPGDYVIIPNFQIKQKDGSAFEYDLVVLAPHAIFVIEEKEWYGRLTGDDQEWLLNQTPKKCPLWLTNTKCKVLKSELKALGNQIYVAPLLIVPDATNIALGGNWRTSVVPLNKASSWLKDVKQVGHRASDVKRNYQYIEKALLGRIAVRRREARRRVAGYEILETLYADDNTAEYIARRVHFESDPSRFRVRTWRLERGGTPQLVEKRKAIIRRPTEAVAKIGRHPNLLPVLHFDFIEDENEFFEVTEWSEFGTLHGYLHNPDRDRLTLRERLEIAAGIASALHAVHSCDVVHRNVCPESIVIGFDRQPRLTDFDRAFIEGNVSVYGETGARRNVAFVPPELEDLSTYDFDSSSDMYSFGAVLYFLLADEQAFQDAADARAKKGRPSKLPSEVRQGIDPRLDDVILALLRTEDFHTRPTAANVVGLLREILSLSASTSVDPPDLEVSSKQFEPGSIVDGVWRIDGQIGRGAFSRVFRVFHLDHQKTYAMKVLTSGKDEDLPVHEWRDAGRIPSHANVAKVIWMDRLAPPAQTPYVLYEFIDGETIEPYCDGRKRFAWGDIKRIATEALDALRVMHEAGIIHRDIKPANILLELPSHKVKLIDFNIATFLGDSSGKAGTPRYCAPDAGQPVWSAEDDLFSFGVVLYELIVHRHPFPRDNAAAGEPYLPNDIVLEHEELSADLAAFLFKAVQPMRANRFKSASEMAAALGSIQAMYAPKPDVLSMVGAFPGLTLVGDEATRQNYNPYVARLLTLYSQARQTNSGTRGLDEIARLTYVPTKLDEKLSPSIASGNFKLVIVTGNAGDGKTAFLQQIEKAFERNATITQLESGNGSSWERDGIRYESNYDGSQDEGDRSSDDVLEKFFSPFRGDELTGLHGTDARLIAINEGRLLDFFAHSPFSAKYKGLAGFVHNALAGRAQPNGALLVNLNLRAVTAGGDSSLVEKQLTKMLDPVLWVACGSCALKNRCPIIHNVNSLRDAASGTETRRRVRRLFEIVHLRRRAHITMRDLRSALSWMLLRDQGCSDVATLLRRTDSHVAADLASLYYTEAFSALSNEDPGAASRRELHDERTSDRLVRRLRESDVGLVNLPPLDRRLDHSPATAVPWMTYENRSNDGFQVFMELWNSAPTTGDDIGLNSLLLGRRRVIERWRRKAYFERRDNGWEMQIPYRSSSSLEDIISMPPGAERDAACDKLRDLVVDAISLSEGLRNTQIGERYLALRITRIKDAKVRSYRLFKKNSFRVDVPVPASQIEYLEFTPDVVELVSEDGGGHARLRISLDLLEMLDLIRSGYRPTTADLGGLFVNLLIFRNELLATHFDRLLVTPDYQEFYEIEARGNASGIELSVSRGRGEFLPGASS